MLVLAAFVGGEVLLVFSYQLPHLEKWIAVLILLILLKLYLGTRKAKKTLFKITDLLRYITLFYILKLKNKAGKTIIESNQLLFCYAKFFCKTYWLINLLLILFITFIGGVGFAVWRAKVNLGWSLPVAYIHKTVEVVGKVVVINKKDRHHVNFIMQLRKIKNNPVHVLVRLGWYNHYPKIKPQDNWRFSVRLKPPRGLHNFAGFNYDRWLFSHHVRAVGYVVATLPQRLLSRKKAFSIAKFRSKVQEIIQQNITAKNIAAIITSLTVGLRDDLTFQDWNILQRTGTSHLFAISGLHVGFIVAIVYWLANFCWRRLPFLLLLLPAQRFAALVSLLVAIGYGALVGWSLPTQRAVIMIVVLFLAEFAGRYIAIWQRLLLAFMIIITLHRFSLFTASLWLSFLAVAALGFSLALAKNKAKWQQWIIVQSVITLGLLPVTLFFFQKISLVSFFANAVAIPAVTMLIVPLSLFSLLVHFVNNVFGKYCYWLVAKCVLWLWWYLSYLSHLPTALWWHGVSNIWILISAMLGLLFLLAPQGWPARWLGLFWCLPLLYFQPSELKVASARLTLLDVGQGLSAIVRTANHTLVYDAGPKSYVGFDAGLTVVLPYLLHENIKRVDTLMISHGDNDHIGGAFSIIKNLTVTKIITSVPQRFHFKNTMACHAGQHWRWDGVKFMVLYPPSGQPYLGNNSSCVLRITVGNQHILLDGDIEKSAEQWLLRHYHDLVAKVVVVPHHGSKTSSSLKFVQAVHPRYALFPLGYYNRFNFPDAKVVRRYQQVGARILTTANSGAIQVVVKPSQPPVVRTVLQNRYFWQKN